MISFAGNGVPNIVEGTCISRDPLGIRIAGIVLGIELLSDIDGLLRS
jgi:hypothetical protein